MITVNLETMTVKDGKKFMIKNGQAVNGYEISNEPVSIEQIEQLYKAYKYSIPAPNERKGCFKALDKNDMTITQLVTGQSRNSAREALEMTLVTGILNGSLTWPGKEHHWFWQSSNDNDLILLKKWFNNQKQSLIKNNS